MKKGAKGMLIGGIAIILLIGTILIYYFGSRYPGFYEVAKEEFEIPGLGEKFIPQGLEYVESENIFLVSGYMADGRPSRIYIINQETSEAIKYVTLEDAEGDYTGHAGGVAVCGDSLWVVGDKKLEWASFSALLKAKNGDKIKINGSMETGNGCDFLWKYDGHLIVGEFYHEKNYKTPESHHIKISEDETNHALCYAYKIIEGNSMGIDSSLAFTLSVPDKAQGICLTKNGGILVSTSYSVPSSKLLVYDNILNGSEKKITMSGKEIPLYILSSISLKSTIEAPSMSEEVAICDGRVFVLFESASIKYKMANRTRMKHVVSLDI